MDSFSGQYRQGAFWALVLVLLLGGIALMLPFVPALLWAGVLSVLMFPVYRRFRARLSKVRALGNGRADTLASLATTTATLLIICVPFLVVGLGLFLQLGSVGTTLSGGKGGFDLDQTLTRIDLSVAPIKERVGATDFSLAEYVQENKGEILRAIRAPAGRFAGNAAYTLLTLIIAVLTMFFMLRDGPGLKQVAHELVPLPKDRTDAILARVAETIHAVFIGTVLVALIQGLVIGIAYAVAGVPHALLLGVASAILCVVPLLGAPVLYVPIGLFLLAQGNVVGAVIVLATGFLVVSQIDNLLKPFLIGGRVNLHPMGVFSSILGGVLLIGPIGIMAGPMLLTLMLAVLEVLRERNREAEDQPVQQAT